MVTKKWCWRARALAADAAVKALVMAAAAVKVLAIAAAVVLMAEVGAAVLMAGAETAGSMAGAETAGSMAGEETKVLMAGAEMVYAEEQEPGEGQKAPGIVLDTAGVFRNGMNTKDAATILFGRGELYENWLRWRVIGYDAEEDSAIPEYGCVTMLESETSMARQYHSGGGYIPGYTDTEIREEIMKETSFSASESAAFVEREEYNGDVLWLLSSEEAESVDQELRMTDPDEPDKPENKWWLIRDMTEGSTCPYVRADGSIDSEGTEWQESLGLRRGFHMNQSRVIFMSAAEGGKTSDVGPDALEEVGKNETGEWKLTLKDDPRNKFKAEVMETDQHSFVTASYTGAEVNDHEYVSALIADKDGNVKYYGKLVDLSQADGPSGTVKIDIEGKWNTGDSIYLFNEQCDRWGSDCSSPLRKLEIEKEQGSDTALPANEYVMEPGETFDCSDMGANTSVYIRKPGDYTIKGKSEATRIMVESVGVRLFLADGLDLNCGLLTHHGLGASPINIGIEDGEQDGQVEIISKKNASVYLEGYLDPAIRKESTTTKLVFETEDAEQPGEITARGGRLSAGIGSSDTKISILSITGNIVFRSGNVTAYGGASTDGYEGGGAGIGGGYCAHADGITIDGGNIKAFGSKESAAIGGGCLGRAKNIIINGGKVSAETDKDEAGSAAAIGSGGGSHEYYKNYADTIEINGGNVTAAGNGGVSIGAGGGDSPDLYHMKITGGTVTAKGADGKVCTGIGAAVGGSVLSMSIEGGVITASGSGGAPAIGAYGHGTERQAMNMKISGGTLLASGGGTGKDDVHYDIGMDDLVRAVTIEITGGSIFTNKIEKPEDAVENELHRVEIGFDGMTDNGKRVDGAVWSDTGFSYGTGDIWTEKSGKVSFWLPESDVTLNEIAVNKAVYEGSVKCSDSEGTLQIAKSSAEPKAKYMLYYENDGVYVGRLRVIDNESKKTVTTTDSCAIGEENTITVNIPVGHTYCVQFEFWYFGWVSVEKMIKEITPDDTDSRAYTVTSTGDVYSIDWKWKDNDDSSKAPVSASIKASPLKVKKGKKTTVKITSNSGAKLAVKTANTKAKSALKKKYVTIKDGKTAKVTFSKKAPKGKYKFKVTSPAKGNCKKTIKTITITVK